VPFRFLIALGLGVLSAIFLLSSLLHDWLDTEPTFLFAFFGGLIVASILAIAVKVKWTPQAIAALIIAGVLAFFIVGLNADENDPVGDVVSAVEDGESVAPLAAELTLQLEEVGFDDAGTQVSALVAALESGDSDVAETLEDDMDEALYEPSSVVTLFLSGMIAICAMILPGISGSFILLILGQYQVVLGAVNAHDYASLGAVAAGAGIGIIVFSRLLSWLLKHYENVTIAALVGFMAGSLRLIWTEAAKGVDVVSDSGKLSGGQIAEVAALIVVGFLLVSLLDHMQSRSNPIFAWLWKPGPPVDTIGEKAEALD
jgi:uncharacterized membrane protein